MIPDEIITPLKEFIKKNGAKMIVVAVCGFISFASLMSNQKSESNLKQDSVVYYSNGPTAPPPVETPKGMNGPAQPR